MVKRTKNAPSALKHGGFAGTTILPGEDEAAFDKLHHDLSVEFAPNGPLEEDIVMAMARLVWRKQNLKIYHLAENASNRFTVLATAAIRGIKIPEEVASLLLNRGGEPEVAASFRDEETAAKMLATFDQIQKEMGADWEFANIAYFATIPNLLNELSVVDRLDGMIDRCIKRLLIVRGVKSLAAPPKSSRSQKRSTAA